MNKIHNTKSYSIHLLFQAQAIGEGTRIPEAAVKKTTGLDNYSSHE